MEKQFVPSELAVKLRDLGYDEECFAHYRSGNFDIVSDKLFIQYNNEFYSEYNKNSLLDGATAPLWQQAFDWFRVEHSIDSAIVVNRFGYYFTIVDVNSHIINSVSTLTYEEARHACIEKLIELSTKK